MCELIWVLVLTAVYEDIDALEKSEGFYLAFHI